MIRDDPLAGSEPTRATPPPYVALPAPEHCDTNLPVFVRPIDGRRPEPQSIARIILALQGVPERFLRVWTSGAGQQELIAGDRARCPPVLWSRARPAAGFNDGVLSVVAADADNAPKTSLHEMGAHA